MQHIISDGDKWAHLANIWSRIDMYIIDSWAKKTYIII